MNKIVAFFILLFICNICFAQEKIVFEQQQATFIEPVKRVYTLPKSVTCTFNDGTKQRLVLERINGDSLIFQKYYNQTQNYDCIYSALQKIKIHKKGEMFLYTLLAGFTGTTIFFLTVANILDHPQTDVGDPSKLFAVVFRIASILPISGAVITVASFPKKYNPHDWKLYAK